MRYTCHVKTKKITTQFKSGEFGNGPTQEIIEGSCDWTLKTDEPEKAKSAWKSHCEKDHPSSDNQPSNDVSWREPK